MTFPTVLLPRIVTENAPLLATVLAAYLGLGFLCAVSYPKQDAAGSRSKGKRPGLMWTGLRYARGLQLLVGGSFWLLCMAAYFVAIVPTVPIAWVQAAYELIFSRERGRGTLSLTMAITAWTAAGAPRAGDALRRSVPGLMRPPARADLLPCAIAPTPAPLYMLALASLAAASLAPLVTPGGGGVADVPLGSAFAALSLIFFIVLPYAAPGR